MASPRGAAVRAFFWSGAAFACWIHLFDRYIWPAPPASCRWLVITGAGIGALNAWSAARAVSRRPRPPRAPEFVLWAFVAILALVFAANGEAAWLPVAAAYAMAALMIAVLDRRRRRSPAHL